MVGTSAPGKGHFLGVEPPARPQNAAAGAGARFVTPQGGTKEACEVRGWCAAAFSIGKGARGRPETRSGLKVSLVRATPKRALLGVPAVKYEITEAYVPYLYTYICARALFPKTRLASGTCG